MGNKYNAKRSGGYDSKLEENFATELHFRANAKDGDVDHWEEQVTLQLYSYGVPVCQYRLDFIVFLKNGTIEFVEIKGLATKDWRIKWKLLQIMVKNDPELLPYKPDNLKVLTGEHIKKWN